MALDNLCRSCMQEVQNNENENCEQRAIDMFYFCTQIMIKEDKLPKKFCNKCIIQLKSSFKYIKRAKEVQTELESLLKSLIKSNIPQTELKHTNTEETAVTKMPCLDTLLGNTDLDKVNNTDKNIERNDKDDKTLPSKNIIREEKLHENIKKEIDVVNVANSLLKSEDEEYYTDIQYIEDDDYDNEDEKPLACFKNNENNTKEPCEANENTSKELVDNTVNDFSSQSSDFDSNRDDKECKVCKRSFKTKNSLKQHMRKTHPKKDTSYIPKPEDESTDTDTEITDEDGAIDCEICGQEFTSYYLRKRHMIAVHQKNNPDEELFLCLYCPKTLTDSQTYNIHMDSHKTCKTCGKQFNTRLQCISHEFKHSKTRPYECNKKFKTKNAVMNHSKVYESGSGKNFLCNECGRIFRTSNAMKSHMRAHTGERPYRCDECPFRSGTLTTLKTHKKRHGGEKQHACPHCPKRFYHPHGLKRHIRYHTHELPYKCPHCPKCFVDSGKRRRHLATRHMMKLHEIPTLDLNGQPVNNPPTRSHKYKFKHGVEASQAEKTSLTIK